MKKEKLPCVSYGTVHRKLKVISEEGARMFRLVNKARETLEKSATFHHLMNERQINLIRLYGVSMTPCRYCKRFDDAVRYIVSDGLEGNYHPHCHARVIQEVMAELVARMK